MRTVVGGVVVLCLSACGGGFASNSEGDEAGSGGIDPVGTAGSSSGASTTTGVVETSGANGTTSGADGSTGASTGIGSTAADDSSGGVGTSGGDAAVVSIEIQPPEATLDIVDGVIPAAVDFDAVATLDDGSTTPVTGTWTFDRPDLADIINTGELTASGLSGGLGVVTFETGRLSAEANVTIKLHITDDDDVDPTVIPEFDDAVNPDPTMDWLYPYDETVFPQGLRGPTIQWNGGADGDIYYIHADSPTFEYEYWGPVPNPSRFDFPTDGQDVWRVLTDSVVGDISVSIQRYDGAEAFLPESETWVIADAVLTGSVYYWEVNNGNVVRLETGADAPETFLEAPEGVGCIACHSVSKDGSTVVASFHGGYSPWGTFDAATGSSILATDTSSGFQAVSPDGSHVLTGHWSGAGFPSDGSLDLSFSDDQTTLAQLIPPPEFGAPSHPAWSTDGNQVAFSMRTDGNGLDFTQSTLWVADVDLVTPEFDNIMQIVANDPARPTITYPTFSPDSAWIAFMRATQARTRGALGEIWVTDTTGATQIPLDRANGVGIIDQTDANYEPTFLPVSLGGYFWLVFVSERTYGNTLTDTNPATRRKQLWVTAIDANPMDGIDPSHPGFWLPGQELDNQNMRGEWALNPCLELGEGCEAGFECCDGFCQPDDEGVFTCTPPGECAQEGEACDDASDCCDEAHACIGGFCAAPVPG